MAGNLTSEQSIDRKLLNRYLFHSHLWKYRSVTAPSGGLHRHARFGLIAIYLNPLKRFHTVSALRFRVTRPCLAFSTFRPRVTAVLVPFYPAGIRLILVEWIISTEDRLPSPSNHERENVPDSQRYRHYSFWLIYSPIFGVSQDQNCVSWGATWICGCLLTRSVRKGEERSQKVTHSKPSTVPVVQCSGRLARG